jgi:hypothetical protein
MVLAVEFSFGVLDAAILGAAVAFAVITVGGLERFVSWRISSPRSTKRARPAPLAAATGAGPDASGAGTTVAYGEAVSRTPFEALGDMYPLLTADAARVLQARFGYSGPGSEPTLPSGPSPERWGELVVTLELPGPGPADEEVGAPRPAAPNGVETVDDETLTTTPAPFLVAPDDERPLVRWVAAVGLMLAVLLLLLIL